MKKLPLSKFGLKIANWLLLSHQINNLHNLCFSCVVWWVPPANEEDIINFVQQNHSKIYCNPTQSIYLYIYVNWIFVYKSPAFKRQQNKHYFDSLSFNRGYWINYTFEFKRVSSKFRFVSMFFTFNESFDGFN